MFPLLHSLVLPYLVCDSSASRSGGSADQSTLSSSRNGTQNRTTGSGPAYDLCSCVLAMVLLCLLALGAVVSSLARFAILLCWQ